MEKPEPPKKPAPDECCLGGGCHDCVWKEYEKKLKIYLVHKEQMDQESEKDLQITDK